MIKKLKIAVFLLVSVLLTVLCAYQLLRADTASSSTYTIDGLGNLYLLTEDGGLTKYNPDGVRLWEIPSEKGSLYTYQQMVCDRSGTLFLYRQQQSKQVDAQNAVFTVMEKEEVVTLSDDEKSYRVLLSVDRSKLSQPSESPYLLKLQPHGEQLLAICDNNGTFEQLLINPYEETEPTVVSGYVYDGDSEKITDFAFLDDQLALSTSTGGLWLLNAKGEKQNYAGLAGNAWIEMLSADLNGNLYFTDLKSGTFYRMNPAKQEIIRLYNSKEAFLSGENAPLFASVRETAYLDEGVFMAVSGEQNSPTYFRFGATEQQVFARQNPFTWAMCLTLLGVFLGSNLVLFGGAALFRLLGRRSMLTGQIMKRFVPACLLVMAVLGVGFFQLYLSAMEAQQSNSTAVAARLAVQEMGTSKQSVLNAGEREQLQERLTVAAEQAISVSGRSDVGLIYYEVADNVLCCALSTLERDQFYLNRLLVPVGYELGTTVAKQVKEREQSGGVLNYRKDGVAYTGYFEPVFDSTGSLSGMVEARVEQSAAISGEQLITLVLIMAFMGVGTLFLVFWLLSTLQKAFLPLKELKRCIGEISGGNWKVKAEVTSEDELAEISLSFNGMTEKMNTYISNMMMLNSEYVKFVPRTLFQLMGKSQITGLKLGDKTVRELGMLHLRFLPVGGDVAESFAGMEQYLERFFDCIEKNKGLVERFDASGVVVFFPYQVQDAVNAAIAIRDMAAGTEMESTLKLLVSAAPTTLGVAGNDKRLSVVAVSEDILRLPLLQEQMNALEVTCVLTESAMARMDKAFYFNCRQVGSGGTRMQGLYEILDGMDPYRKKLCLVTKKDFEAGVRCFQERQYQQARKYFVSVLQVDETDKTAVRYMILCDNYQAENPSQGGSWLTDTTEI